MPALSLASRGTGSCWPAGIALVRRKHLPPFEVEIERLGRGSVGVGTAPDGAPVQVRGAPPGSRVHVVPQGRSKGVWQGRRVAMIRPPSAWDAPPCGVFGLCGGCALQELRLPAQRVAKTAYALAEIAAPMGITADELARRVVLGPTTGAPAAYGYRNRIELSFGPRRYVSEADRAADAVIEGRWLGFHAPGRFDRVVDAPRCELADEAANRLITAIRTVALAPDAPPPWDARDHVGFWRYVLIRTTVDGDALVALITAPAPDEGHVAWVERAIDALHAAGLGPHLVGVVWAENAGVADVARGEVRRTWGRPWLEERLGDVAFKLSPTSFFQTNTPGAKVLYDAVGAHLGGGGTLVDLYCGTGAIGLYLADRFDRVVGIEEHAPAVEDARANAVANGIHNASFTAARVEDALPDVVAAGARAIVVDPPRVGLHPKVAALLATIHCDVLVYVACHPASLGRDAVILEAGGWRMTDLQIVDLFPQTGHVEAVGVFRRAAAT
jgi:23S rRNA (uracil1939-C5)-methyltransferase